MHQGCIKYNLKQTIMKPFVVLSIMTLIICITSCQKSNPDKTDNSGLVIKAGFVCGWGAGEDSIEITQTEIKYVYYVPSISQQPQIRKNRTVSISEWAEIINDVNMDDFVKLNYQTCNVCVDGCDEWIFIQKDSLSHEIRFDKGATIDTISNLQIKLGQLREEFNPER